MSTSQRALIVVRPFFVALGFVFIGLLLFRQWDSLQTYQWQISPTWLAASGVLMLAGWLIEIRLWQRALDLVGGRLDYRSAVRIWFPSSIVRFIPGNIWQPLSMTVLCREREIRPESTLASMTLFHAIHVMAIGAIAAFYTLTWGRAGTVYNALGSLSLWSSIVVAVPELLLLIYPRRMLALANRILEKVGREPLPLRLSTGQLLRLLGLSLVAWLLLSASFVSLTAALTEESGRSLADVAPHLAAAYPIAYAIGFLSLLTPSGLGVREGVLFVLLQPLIGGGDAVIVAVAMRVWEIVLEVAVTVCVIGMPWLSYAPSGGPKNPPWS